MRGHTFFLGWRLALAIFSVILFATSSWAAPHNFGDGDNDGYLPGSGLIIDAHGNLYGTTAGGGTHGDGTVFELSPRESGGWTETVLHSFGNGTDGQLPFASLIFDGAGNLYGTTTYGGIHGYGTVFKLSPREDGTWEETVLHSFNLHDGAYPDGGLTFDAAGNLYGTTSYGGIHYNGTAFELMPREGRGWTETVLHSFGRGTDGSNPLAGLTFDAAGNLYGTTSVGGIHNPCDGETCGTVFELSPNGSGGWTENVLHSFGRSTDGSHPFGGLIFDAAGNRYGTTQFGGYGDGTAFEMSPEEDGGWTEKVLHRFGRGTDGSNPLAGLTFDAAGNLYGTTFSGGVYNDGTVFELSPNENGGWTDRVLHNFDLNGTDGLYSYANLILDAAGNLYGAALYGGIYGHGIVFEITP
ncbi:MAG: choice-of-anchor tandem repeat GloVer-containing protein [Candidatus Korobacteraceae bacterium]